MTTERRVLPAFLVFKIEVCLKRRIVPSICSDWLSVFDNLLQYKILIGNQQIGGLSDANAAPAFVDADAAGRIIGSGDDGLGGRYTEMNGIHHAIIEIGGTAGDGAVL